MTQITPPAPVEIRTQRVLLRPWRTEDAPDLLPVLEANRDHLGPWIPARVATPAPVPVLADGKLLGEVALFPRAAAGRVPFAEADRVELGYWLRSDETGQGIVTEAARAALNLASHIPRFSRAEIRCDARNGPSGIIPVRLGFTLLDTKPEAGADGVHRDMQLWVSELANFHTVYFDQPL
jgi:ribosomal-protein-serine acetyltransferase